MWIHIKSYKPVFSLPQRNPNRFNFKNPMKQIIKILTIPIILTSFLYAGALQFRSGVLTLTSDRGDSTLLRQAVQLIHHEQSSYAMKYGLRLDRELQINFYYDKNAMGSRGRVVPYWSAGIARAGSEIHIFGQNRRQWLATLKHELFHTLLGQNEVSIPVWLNEGMAQWQAGQMDWGGFMELGTATARGKLIPLVDMDVILSFNHKRANLAYGQALDATRFLIKRYGESVLPYLLRADARGFRERFKMETGEDLIDFEIAWRENLESRFWFFKISTIPTVLWALSPLIVVLAWFLKRQRGKRKIQEWEQEDTLLD